MHGVKFGLAVTAGSKETERRLVCYPEPGKKGFRLFVSGLMPGSPVFTGGGGLWCRGENSFLSSSKTEGTFLL